MRTLKENYAKEKYRADLYCTKFNSLKDASQSLPLTEKTGQNILAALETLTRKN